MELWIPITIGAAFVQNIRSSLQKHLRSRMGTAAATFVRFGYGLPFAALFLWISLVWTDSAVPPLSVSFGLWLVVAALSQIIAQALLIVLFTLKNFAAGSAYVRVEPVLAAAFGVALLGEAPSLSVMVAVMISVIGVMLISVASTKMSLVSLIGSLGSREALIGLASAAIFGLAAVAYRGASLSLGGPNFIVQGAVTLTCAIALQTIIVGVWICLREPGEFRKLANAWRPGIAVGFVGALASFGWFTAMTLQQAAIVKALAQIEMLFAIATTIIIFREKISRRELIGCGLIVCGVLLIVL